MKKYLAAFLAVSLFATSCEDFLTKENPNSIDSEYFFTNETSLELYANGLVRSYATKIKDFIDGDRFADTQAWNGEYLFYTTRYNVASNTSWSWTNLRSINYFLENLRQADAEPDVLDHYEGVGRFFRALFYIAKVQQYGANPWYDHVIDPTDTDALYRARDDRSFVCRKILEDLDYACEHCSGDARYRVRSTLVNKYVALAVKARFCLFEGTYRKYHDNDPSTGKAWTAEEKAEGQAYLRACAEACEAVMDSRLYSLVDDPAKRATQYRQMFTDLDGCGNFTSEWIWARDYDEALNVKNTDYSINDYMLNAQHANYAFNRDFVMTYLMLDGTPFTSRYEGEDYYYATFAEETAGRDLRLAQTIKTPGFKRDGGKWSDAPSFLYAMTGYQPVKWLTDYIKDAIDEATFTDVPLIRYAEVLLSYAEAKAELGECGPDVWDKTVRLTRERAGVTSIYPAEADPYMVKYFNGKVTDPVILEIRRERGIEFTMENLRQQDIRRWHMGELLVRVKTGMYIPALETDLDLDGDGTPDNIVSNRLVEKAAMSVLPVDLEGGNENFSTSGNYLSDGDHGYILGYTKYQQGYQWTENKYLYPIPSADVTSNPDLVQNAGW
ncbi:MAG: RagB/SusD family nutrient uptake outer membrane protein [Bacteroidales bacterium]|nr:RagB/SusD family nutrient uptake outer membrane protein [Bacteroidales bacterium]